MKRFTKDQMREELRDIFLYQADHIACCGARAAAEEFIGFPAEDEDGLYESYWGLQPSRVDLNRFQVSRYLDRAYDFAFHPSLLHHIDPVELGTVVAFMNGTPRAIAQDIDSIDPLLPIRPPSVRFMGQEGYCQTVTDTAVARWKLEISGLGTFTPRELALLANMSEGAVRNAMSEKTGVGLKTILGSKPTQVEHEEALRWLQGRRGFEPIPRRVGDDVFAKEKLATVRDAQEFSRLVDAQITAFLGGHSFESTSFRHFNPNGETSFQIERTSQGISTLGWSNDELKAWRDGSFQFEHIKAANLAEALEFDVPLFVGKALEVSLRRDTQNHGDRS